MKNTIFVLGILALFLAACKPDSKSTAETAGTSIDTRTLLAGHWVALDFCSRANQYGSVLAAMNNAHLPYAFAVSFDPNKPDSAICYNGIEKWALPVKITADTIEMLNARPGKSVFLIYHSQGNKEMSMFDGTTGTMQLDKFIKSKANARDGYLAFTVALNHNLFNGVFTQLGKGGKNNIQFTPGGFIMNWGPFDRYEVCTNGDCFMAGNEIDVMTVSKSTVENSEKYYGFRYSAQNDTLTLYNLATTNPDEKGTYQPKGIAYQFFRKPAE